MGSSRLRHIEGFASTHLASAMARMGKTDVFLGETNGVVPCEAERGNNAIGTSFGPQEVKMETFLVSTFVVALAEIGDKTQLLAIVLATRFKKPIPIILGIFCATIANHTLAAMGGYYLANFLSGFWFQLFVGLSFIAMAAWILVPDSMDDEKQDHRLASAFLTTLVAFFLIEIGDKTQIATAALAARFHEVVLVAAGTTAGMMLADVPAVYLAERATTLVPLKYVRMAAALLFLVLGLLQLIVIWR